jgi:uncharacterized protein
MEQSGRLALAGALLALTFSAAAAAHEESRPRLLTVAGIGEVKVVPDRADVSFAVEASEKALADAEKAVGEGVARLLKLCESLDIAKAQVRSAQLSVQPQYDGSIVSNRPRIVGYMVSRQIDVDLRDLGKLGRLLQGAVEGGANRVSGVSFGSTKKDEHQRAALALAAEDAKANAVVLARSMGVKLGRLHTLTASESGGYPPPAPYLMRMAEAKAMQAPEATYQPGEMAFTANVTVEFDLP